jgi:hypothetical protein
MPTRRRFIGASAASLALSTVVAGPIRTLAQNATPTTESGDSSPSGPPIVGTPSLKPQVDLVRAQEIALAGNPGTVVTKIELDGEDGVLEYAIQLDNGIEVDIDATTGAITKTESSGDGSGDSNDDENDDENSDDAGDNSGDHASSDNDNQEGSSGNGDDGEGDQEDSN